MKSNKEHLRYCPVCGTPVKPGDKYCGNCGARLISKRAPLTFHPYVRVRGKDDFSTGLIIGVVIGLIIGGVIGAIFTYSAAAPVKTVTSTIMKIVTVTTTKVVTRMLNMTEAVTVTKQQCLHLTPLS